MWMSTVEDLSKAEDPNAVAQALLENTVAGYQAQGYGVSDAHIVAAGADEHEGKEAFSAIFYYTIVYSAILGSDLAIGQYCFQTFVADEDFGTYIFTIAADTVENAQPCMALMNTIKWTD